jgi:ribose transport system substrate-binding protein
MRSRAPVIAVFTKNRTNDAYAAARMGAERTAARLGARVVHYVPQRPDDVEEQIALVGHAIAARPEAVLFVPVHDTAMNASVRKLNDAGIPVVNLLNRLTEGKFVTFVGSDDYRIGYDIAARLFRHLGGKGDIVVLEGVPGAVTSRDRVRGFQDALAQWPGIRAAASRAANYQQETARRVVAELLPGLPHLDGILSANDVMSLGAIEALEAAGRSAAVVGVNALPAAITAIKCGKLLATVDFDALKIACVAAEAAIRHLRGQPVPKDIELPVQIVDAANCQPWDRPLEERECPRWDDVVKER